MGKLSRRKGASFERQVAKVLGGFRAGTLQSGTRKLSDVEGTEYWVETKHQKRVNIQAAIEQAREARDKAGDGRLLLVVSKDNRGLILCTMLLDEFIRKSQT